LDFAVAQAMKGFGFKSKRAQRGKAGTIVFTDSGARLLIRIEANPADILFWHKTKEHLANFDILTDRFYLAQDGQPYLDCGPDRYLLTDFHETHDDLFFDDAAFLKTIAALAKIHAILAKSDIAATGAPRPGNELGADAKKTMAHLRSTRKKLEKSGRFSDFDMMFLGGMKFFQNAIENWIELTQTPEIAGLLAHGRQHHICHNILKEENICISNIDIVFMNFTAAAPAHFAYDLAYITKRYLQRGTPPTLIFPQILDIYAANNPIAPAEETLLRALLLFPDKFIKISDSYYFKKRAFVPINFSTRMEEIFNTKEAVVNFVNG